MAIETKAAPKLTVEQELAALRAENEALRKAQTAKVRVGVSAKGGVSIYGMGRFPITLYASQWLTIFGMADDIKAFIATNAGKLRAKGDPEPVTVTEPVLPDNPTPAQITEYKTALAAFLAAKPAK